MVLKADHGICYQDFIFDDDSLKFSIGTQARGKE